jgi:hypothetical protein
MGISTKTQEIGRGRDVIQQLALADVDRLCRGIGTFDVACPFCGPQRRHALNRRRKVMRIWRSDPYFASWHCERCGISGHSRDKDAPKVNDAEVVRIRRETQTREIAARKQRLGIAQFLWGRRCPLPGSPGERYLRETRGYDGPIPATLGFLPARGDHAPAMIAAFGLPDEVEPGAISMRQAKVTGVHVTRLSPDGRKAGTETDKIMIGYSTGSPIVLAPPNDLLGLVVVEGIEKGLALLSETGLGVWVAGSASRMPALADAIPAYVDCVTVFSDGDKDGDLHALTLAKAVRRRKIYCDVELP